jgi:3-isopropylmalate/(R)-2-methylmalate dehydratase small subunit
MMRFTTLLSVGLPMREANIDTDQIIPARFLQRPRASGFGDVLFHDLRFDDHGQPKPDFLLNRSSYQGAAILVAGGNFGCGSSRETAVYALMDHGFRAVVSPSFGDIFHRNALLNGLLPVVLDEAVVGEICDSLLAEPGTKLAVDLPAQVLTTASGRSHRFDIDSFRKLCLLEGMDEIDLTMAARPDLEAYEERLSRTHPWL